MLSSFKPSGRTLNDQFPVLYQHRYCDQEEFSIGVFSNDIHSGDSLTHRHFLLNNFDTKTYLPTLPIYDRKAIACSSTVYFAGELEGHDNTLSVVKYSFSTKCWNKLPLLEGVLKRRYKVCSFMQKVFVISEGGYKKPSWFYNKDINKWTSIASIMDDRKGSALTVFQGRIVISGGVRKKILPDRVYPGGMVDRCLRFSVKYLNTIEAYDYHENKWSYFPSMLSPRVNHTVVNSSNKMIIIGGNSDCSEIFDSVTRKFTYIKTLPKWVGTSKLDWHIGVKKPYQVVDIANKIYFFRMEKNKFNIHSYDVRNDHFAFKTSMETENFEEFSCVKIPMI